jgi:acetylornithine/succinyldiaminopimelate/putrescine aminotransferase
MTATSPDTEVTADAQPDRRNSILGTYKRAPMKFIRGEGVELIDENGKRYLDFESGIAVNSLGYGDSVI